MKEVIKITFPSYSRNESFARGAVSAYAIRLDPTLEELNDVKAAVSEAVTNSVVHGYPDRIGIIELSIWSEKNVLYIRVKDKGLGIADVEQAMQPLFTTATDGERAGLGFAVMEDFCDNVSVKSAVGKGTVVTLSKKIKSRANNI
ncbi:MAG: anti-sigma F factor [Oscillospiraceae bacterium]|jgi:stage II sporulation protein AB (anti-sigma F factor)|nr:anti-sigma F factor [Oscillospiraceae bacterium]